MMLMMMARKVMMPFLNDRQGLACCLHAWRRRKCRQRNARAPC
jgi:hypothetical protein